MTDFRNSDVGVGFLERLLYLSERSPDRSRAASAAPDYDSLPRADQLARFQERMTAAEKFGAVEIVRGRRERSHLMDRIRVKDQTLLAKYLGRTPASQIAEIAKAELRPIASAGEPWVLQLLEEMASRWARGETAYRLAPVPLDPSKEFLLLLAAVSRNEAFRLDARTFSLRATGDTKAFDRHASRMLAVLGARMEEPGAAAERVWANVGLERFSHPIHLKGPVLVEGRVGVLVDGNATPFASVHPEMLPLLKVVGQPHFLLTVENYASFNRQVREIENDGLIVYLGGFPSAGVVSLLDRLLSEIRDDVPFFHWGDIDPGGLKIFRFLEETLRRPPRPHLMTRELAEEFGKPMMADSSLRAIGGSNSAIADLAEWMSMTTDPKFLEQETLDPSRPFVE
ncbi:Wadjet anti-phage system protein JetD domain-containing protein [Afipia sp. GAS231]|uniref:Wadjet anti-phage system protein JetD domain-containing protein n=1 Tax=Afipia sp. GAS231 TaxID=1882747 RepID=UPI00087C4247|nr:Wadjet anti-phage system protein JetD domain-containing protein [Afipia sp. GAS231]SDO49070.1 hypothetical protein SAMN05444050_4263 [Afipia sp. GAS231]